MAGIGLEAACLKLVDFYITVKTGVERQFLAIAS